MAYLTGLITEPVFDKHVDIENESLEKKLASVCQDIVFLSSEGTNIETYCTGNDWLSRSD